MLKTPLSTLAVSDISAGTRIGNISEAYVSEGVLALVLQMNQIECLQLAQLLALASWLGVSQKDISLKPSKTGLVIEILQVEEVKDANSIFQPSDDPLESLPDTECCGSGMCRACPSQKD